MIKDSPKILIVEDDKFLNKLLALRLKKEGAEVVSVYNGSQALEEIKKNNFNLIVLDLILPQKDGFEVLAEIQEIRAGIPIVVLSNLGQEADIENVLKFGVKDFIVKVDNPLSEVIEKIKKHF